MGDWMKYNSASIYGCTQAPDEYKAPTNCIFTFNPTTKRLYVHLMNYPIGKISLPNLQGKVKYAQFLHDNSEIKFINKSPHQPDAEKVESELVLSLPVLKPNVEIPVIELLLK
jgi:alpha-L-fucosidase